MPLVEITLIAGRDPQTLRDLIHQVHEAVRRSLDAPPRNIRVLIRELPPEHWAAGDVTIAERRAASPAPGTGTPPGHREDGASGRDGRQKGGASARGGRPSGRDGGTAGLQEGGPSGGREGGPSGSQGNEG